ncbi:MAG: hypothetical protein VYD01_02935 [Pseudomonadota bacterium]|nr:hypothetical protein [Pseudomonadota bacterium]
MSKANILTELSVNANHTLKNARSLPPAIYHDEDILDLEIAR